MIISFSVFREKIESGEKNQTIRKFNDLRYLSLCNAKKYQLYWQQPRNGGTLIKEVEPSIAPFVVMFDRNPAAPLIQVCETGLQSFYPTSQRQLAKNDGFDTPEDLFRWFYEKYGEDLFNQKFMVIRWMVGGLA